MESIEMNGIRGLKLIGVRFYPYIGENKEDEKKARFIQKSLYGRTDWFYFNQGFTIYEEGDIVTRVPVDLDVFKSSIHLYSKSDNKIINVSAIVGENGTGKSTLVDIIIRLLNNLSASIFGETFIFKSGQHLHYIDNVYASLAVYVDGCVKLLSCKGRNLTLTDYHGKEERIRIGTNHNKIVNYYPGLKVPLCQSSNQKELLIGYSEKKHLLNSWFYTLVSNYSLYAYNYRDFESEATDEDRLGYFKDNDLFNGDEDRYWLTGVFHKNDGYQTPFVISPIREKGFVNTEKENKINKQILVSLAFEQMPDNMIISSQEKKVFPFRIINKSHLIYGLKFSFSQEDTDLDFEDRWIRKKLGLYRSAHESANLEIPIKQYWSNKIGRDYSVDQNTPLLKEAWDYLAYKTIKVINTYNHYYSLKASLASYLNSPLNLDDLLNDNSNRTLKLRQTIVFLRFFDDKNYYLNFEHIVSNESIWDWMCQKIGNELYPGKDIHKIKKDDLLPPPFLNVDLQLIDIKEKREYQNIEECNIIPFSGLSSGERQIAYTIGSIVYHIKNIVSAKDDLNGNYDHFTAIKYNYINIMLDEVELYFHPDLQRRFLDLLISSVNCINTEEFYGINLTLVTHSPFVLSDIPSSNILYLSRDNKKSIHDQTFAANVHDLFDDAFYLPNTMGAIAQRELENIVSYYNEIKSKKSGNGKAKLNVVEREAFCKMIKMRYVVSIIGDEYLHNELNDMLDEIQEWERLTR